MSCKKCGDNCWELVAVWKDNNTFMCSNCGHTIKIGSKKGVNNEYKGAKRKIRRGKDRDKVPVWETERL